MNKHFCAFLMLVVMPFVIHANERKNRKLVKTEEVSLVGSPRSLEKQNLRADEENLLRIMDDETLSMLKSELVLLPIPEVVILDPRLDLKWQFTLYQTQVFILEYGSAFIDKFGHRTQINSAVRTWPRQVAITKEGNHNANLPIEGPRRPPHITGATIDIAKIGLNLEELEWWRSKLLYLEEQGLVEATEEWNQLVFHVMVFSTYLGESEGHY